MFLFLYNIYVLRGPQGHPYECFPKSSNYIIIIIYIYIYIYVFFLCHIHECAAYIIKEVVSFREAGLLIGGACKRINVCSLHRNYYM